MKGKYRIQGESTTVVFLSTNDGVNRLRQHCKYYVRDGGKCLLKKNDPWSDKCGYVSHCDNYEEPEKTKLCIDSISSTNEPKQSNKTRIEDKFYRYKPSIRLDIEKSTLRFKGYFEIDNIKYLVLKCGRDYFIFAKKNIDDFFFFLNPKIKIFQRMVEQIDQVEMDIDMKRYRKNAFLLCDLLKKNGINFDSYFYFLDVYGKGKDSVSLSDIVSFMS